MCVCFIVSNDAADTYGILENETSSAHTPVAQIYVKHYSQESSPIQKNYQEHLSAQTNIIKICNKDNIHLVTK